MIGEINLLYLILAIIGAAVGSFINVLGPRYTKKDGFSKGILGRSRCIHCRRNLRWFELIPVISFLWQGGKCRRCHKSIPWSYTVVELLSASAAVLVPLKLGMTVPALIWVLAFWILILVSVIDLRLKLIPNELVVLLALLGLANVLWYQFFGPTDALLTLKGASFIGHYALVFTLSGSVWLNHILSITFGGLLFGALYYFSKGKAMGLGDVKLVVALGTLVVWPDIVLALTLPFILGSVVGLTLIALGKAKIKSSIPFGPYIAAGVTLVFFFGYDIVNGYFQLFGVF